MQTLVTAITAAALLWHTVAGCCAHAHAGSCACGHGAAARPDEPTLHDRDDEHNDEHACEHRPENGARNADRDGDHDATPAPCRGHCEGNRCLAIASGATWQPNVPDVAWDILPPLAVTPGAEAVAPYAFGCGHDPVAALALPVRAHLFYRILLI